MSPVAGDVDSGTAVLGEGLPGSAVVAQGCKLTPGAGQSVIGLCVASEWRTNGKVGGNPGIDSPKRAGIGRVPGFIMPCYCPWSPGRLRSPVVAPSTEG